MRFKVGAPEDVDKLVLSAMPGVPLTYTPMFWSLVFPLGMYALASLKLSLAADFAPLRSVSLVMVWIALAAWGATAVGLLRASWRGFAAADHG